MLARVFDEFLLRHEKEIYSEEKIRRVTSETNNEPSEEDIGEN